MSEVQILIVTIVVAALLSLAFQLWLVLRAHRDVKGAEADIKRLESAIVSTLNETTTYIERQHVEHLHGPGAMN